MPVRLVSQEELPGPLKGYRLIERLGRGGFGEVWKVEAPGGLLKAMKFVFGDLDSADEDGRPAEQELKALHRVKTIRHPYILSLERFDIIDGQLIIVMELADRNLWDRFRECRGQGYSGIPREELLRYMEESAEALDLMNNHYQIQHLDVKPQNIFLVFNHVKVADFGLAKAFEGIRATVTGGVTPVYAAPETFEGWISRFSDQYSLSIVFQELLTGTRPFNGANTKQLLMLHLNGVPELGPLPEGDRAIIGRALSKKPDDRWPTCMEMVRALKASGLGTVAGGSGSDVSRSKDETPRPGVLPPPTPPIAPRRPGPVPASPVPPSGSGGLLLPPRSPGTTPGLSSSTLGGARLVTPQGAAGPGGMPSHTLQRPQIFQTARMSSLGIAPPERADNGVLIPALLVAVGQSGLSVLRRFRQLVRDRFGSLDATSHLRFLYIDTDPETANSATQGADPLASREVILARLNRPSHYLQQSSIPNLDSWMPPGLLYRLPKNPGAAAGVRAFGRLAFCDNYRVIAQRIRQEIETFLTDDPLDKAAATTGLGVRSNRARAYILAGLAGGTGSGIAMDLAFVVKQELRSVGYRKPETVGVLLAPPADKVHQKSAALANTYAALAEVYHFAAGHRFQTRFAADEAPITDGDGPFTRTAIVNLPRAVTPPERNRGITLAARSLYVDLLTASGRVTDYVRSVTPVSGDAGVPIVQTFGLYRMTWPRAELLAAATRRFSQRLLQRWAGKEATHLKEPIRDWLIDQWAKQQLDPEAVVARFAKAAKDALRENPDAVFEAAVDTLRTRTPGAGRMDATAACGVFDQLLKLVGKPEVEHEAPGSLDGAIQESYQAFAAETEGQLATMAVSFIEQPQYRLAGAEEALNQLTEKVKDTSEQLESIRDELRREVRELYGRVFQIVGNLSATGLAAFGGRKSSLTGELLDTLRLYPARRLRLSQIDAALALYRGLLNHMPDYLRDVNFCRSRLGELGQLIAAHTPPPSDPASELLVLPPGCATLDEAADLLISSLAPDDLLAFDQALQTEVSRKYRGIANVCLKPDRSAEFVTGLTAQSRGFLDARLERTDPATVFLRYRGDGPDALRILADGYDRAAPDLTAMSGPRPLEATILAVPSSDAGHRLARLVGEAIPGIEFIPAPLPDDVLIYREYPRLPLTALPHLAAGIRETYDAQVAAGEPPHTRADISWVVPG